MPPSLLIRKMSNLLGSRETAVTVPPTAPLAICRIGVPSSGVRPSVCAGHENIELVGVTAHGRHGPAWRSGAVENLPPALPLPVRHVSVGSRRVNTAVVAHQKDVQLVGVARDGADRPSCR